MPQTTTPHNRRLAQKIAEGNAVTVSSQAEAAEIMSAYKILARIKRLSECTMTKTGTRFMLHSDGPHLPPSPVTPLKPTPGRAVIIDGVVVVNQDN